MKAGVCLAAAVAAQSCFLEPGKKTLFGSAPRQDVDRTSRSRYRPSKNIALHYTSSSPNSPSANVNVTHTMKYPTVVLEDIASLINVDCSPSSVAMTFNDASVFSSIRGSWSTTNQTLVFVTNHLGDCDEELERSFFIAKRLSWDSKNLVAVAISEKTDVEHTAASTEISFGGLPANDIRERALVLDPSFTLGTSLGLPPATSLYKYEPYLNVVADTATFTAQATFSGYLKYNWWGFKLEALYFDLDASFESQLALRATVASSYSNTFTYAPEALRYGFSIPGILEIGPQLIFSVDAFIAASETLNLTASIGAKLEDGNVHLDVLNSVNTKTSGWTPAYFADVGISAVAAAQINPTAHLTVELEVNFFGGLVDLTTGITASPGFTNAFVLTAKESASTTGKIGTRLLSCPNGLAIDSDFNFKVDAQVTQWWKGELYSVSQPIVDKCYTWK